MKPTTLRIVAGAAISAWGWSRHEQTVGIILMLVGLVPLPAGLFNVCLLARSIGAPFAGKDVQDGSFGM